LAGGVAGNLCPPDRTGAIADTDHSKEPAMKSLTTLFPSLILSLALAGAAIAGETVNINTADAATIDRVLVNVGPSKAQAIVDYRKENGAFKSAEQLAMVKGIGLKTVEKNRDRIVLGAPRPAAPAAPAAQKVAAKPAPAPVARR
jgi:competence protein ComEA